MMRAIDILYRLLITLAVAITLPLSSAFARVLSPLEVLNNCYVKLTGISFSLSSPLRASLESNSTHANAIALCSKLIDSVRLNSSTGSIEVESADSALISIDEARRVVRNLDDFHRTQYLDLNSEITSFVTDTMTGRNETPGAIDFTEPALVMTRALFGRDGSGNRISFSSILLGTTSVEALRDGPVIGNQNNGTNNSSFNFLETGTRAVSTGYCGGAAASVVAVGGVGGVKTGSLLGIKPVNSKFPSSLQPCVSNYIGVTSPHTEWEVRPNQSYGAGILGLQAYLMQNLGIPDGRSLFDGGNRMGRRWSQAVLKNFMCRDIAISKPIRYSDASIFVNRTIPQPADLPNFRKGQSCMQCHATLDSMAGVVRDMRFGIVGTTYDSSSGLVSGNDPYKSIWIAHFKGTRDAAEVGFVNKDTSFYRRPNNGGFYYRNSDGAFVGQSLSSLENLGQALISQDDFYNCAASKYLQFMTGLSAPLIEAADPLYSSLTASQIETIRLIKNLGAQLKTSGGDSGSLIKNIMNEAVFLNRGN